MYSLDDTIAAISTPLGEGGIGIVRLSGREALPILRRLFRGVADDGLLEPRCLRYGHIVDPASGQVVDEVLVSYMQAPRTYTRQDVVEINAHGGIVPLRHILELTLRHGARLASPGEFTVRAFLNGRLDLAQAEAVMDIVRARTEAGLRVAVDQLGGRLSQEVRAVRAHLVDLLAYLEAAIDFPEDEVPPLDIAPALEQARARMERLLAHADQGIIYRQGVRVAIVGRPNVGKSTLLNALLRTERAIVTPIPGTTRDTLEETMNLQGIPLVLVDTAGIAATEDLVERLGVERSQQALRRADLALLVVDGSEPLTMADREIAGLVDARPAILVINKSDRPQVVADPDFLPGARRVRISALTREGLEALEEALAEAVLSGRVVASDELLVSHPRHKAILQRALEQVTSAQEAHGRGMPSDFVAMDLTAAIHGLGEITGETASEDLLETIFRHFCVGK
jgi:tRNA modification GTPase